MCSRPCSGWAAARFSSCDRRASLHAALVRRARLRLRPLQNGPWSYDQFFVLFALVNWGVSALTGMLFLGPETSKLGKLMPTRPPDDPEVQYPIRRILLIVRLDILLLLAVVFVMTAKPYL